MKISILSFFCVHKINYIRLLRGCIIIKNKKKTKFIYSEEFKTRTPNFTKEELKEIFNKKYFVYIMRKENRY